MKNVDAEHQVSQIPGGPMLTRHRRASRRMAVLAIVAAVATSGFGIYWRLALAADKEATFGDDFVIYVVGAWAFFPALWLFIEWFYYLRRAVEAREITIEAASHEQSVVRALWAGFLLFVAAMFGILPVGTLVGG